MPEHMWSNMQIYGSKSSILVYHSTDCLVRQGFAELVDEKVLAGFDFCTKISFIFYKFTSLSFNEQSSEILIPVANKSSITAASRKALLFWYSVLAF